MQSQTRSLKQAFKQFVISLQGIYGENEARSLAYRVFGEVLGYSKTKILMNGEELLHASFFEQLDFILHELKLQKPVQYVLGKGEFCGLQFKVNPHVLIPRPETEELVQWILETCQSKKLTSPKILDVGTGSGCIAVSLKKKLQQSEVWAMDVSPYALKVAEENASLNKVYLKFIQADILHIKQDTSSFPLVDIIVSNPPYVRFSEAPSMQKNVLDFEPHSAIFVPDSDALIFYKKIADFSLRYLQHGGLLFFEINEALGKEMLDMLSHKGFDKLEIRKDISGLDRMVKAEYAEKN